MRAHARLRERRVDVLVYVREYVRAYVHMSLSHSFSLSLSLSVRAFTRSLHRCESCTRKSCRCSRQALPGRVSLSGNVPTEQPTLALTLCPFRGVLWREPCLFLSHSLLLSLSLSPADSLSLPRSPIRPSSTIPLPPPRSINLSRSSSLRLSYPTLPRSPFHG